MRSTPLTKRLTPRLSQADRRRGRCKPWSALPKRASLEHFDLVTHRVPKPDVERTLFTAGMHRLLGKPAKPFAYADGHDNRHRDLGWVGRCNSDARL